MTPPSDVDAASDDVLFSLPSLPRSATIAESSRDRPPRTRRLERTRTTQRRSRPLALFVVLLALHVCAPAVPVLPMQGQGVDETHADGAACRAQVRDEPRDRRDDRYALCMMRRGYAPLISARGGQWAVLPVDESTTDQMILDDLAACRAVAARGRPLTNAERVGMAAVAILGAGVSIAAAVASPHQSYCYPDPRTLDPSMDLTADDPAAFPGCLAPRGYRLWGMQP